METKKQLPDRENLGILTYIILYAEEELNPTFDRMLEEGKKLTNREVCKMVADKAYVIMCDALRERDAGQ